MSRELRTGLLGAGGFGTANARALEETTHATIEAIADVSDESRQNAGDQFRVSPSYRFSDHRSMFETADLDAVIVATPHSLHYEHVLAAMEHDLHVLCEKPLTTGLDESRDLVDRNERRDTVLMVGYQRHIEGPYVATREKLGEFDGHPKFVTASITQDWISGTKDTWRSDPDLSGGGQLYDTGSHVIDFVLWATDLEPTAVDASMVFWDDDRRVDTQATLNVEFEADAVASISVSGDAPQVREHHRFWTDDGAVAVDGRGWNDRTVHVVDADGGEHHPWAEDRYPHKTAAFVEAIESGSEPPSTPEHALRVTAVTEAAYESARTGERVDVDL